MSEYVELKTFKRINDEKIALEGIIYSIYQDRWIPIPHHESGYIIQSIRVGDSFYYPAGFDTRKQKPKQ